MADLAMDVWLWAHDEYSSAFRQFGAAAEGMHSKIGLLAHGVGLLADGMGSLAGGILGDAVKEAAQYESVTQGMANNTNMTKAQLDDMRTASIALSEQTGQDAERIAEGWMHISNHLYEGAAAYNIASASAKNAAGTNGNVADDANILAGVLREYNVQAKDLARNNELATRYMDTLHNAVANSNWTNITSFFGGVWSGISGGWQGFWNTIGTWLHNKWTDITTDAGNVWSGITSFFGGVWGAIRTGWEGFWTNLGTLLHGWWTDITADAGKVWDGVSGFFGGVWGTIRRDWDSFWSGIGTLLHNAWVGIENTATSDWNNVTNVVSGVWGGISTQFQKAWDTIKGTLVRAWTTLKNTAHRSDAARPSPRRDRGRPTAPASRPRPRGPPRLLAGSPAGRATRP